MSTPYPAVAVTTARALDAAAPPARYLEVVRAGLVERGFTDAEADAYLRDLLPAKSSPPTDHVRPERERVRGRPDP